MKLFFFFSSVGPGMFCRSGKLGDQREAWEEKRTSLRDVLDFKVIYMEKWIIMKKKNVNFTYQITKSKCVPPTLKK